MSGRLAALLMLSVAFAAAPSAAQSQASRADTAITVSPFRQLALPSPNLIRTGSGRPGSRYWQQRADYRIQATLDPESHELRGKETIHYVNRSPDALPYLWLFVEQNICGPTSVTEKLESAAARLSRLDLRLLLQGLRRRRSSWRASAWRRRT